MKLAGVVTCLLMIAQASNANADIPVVWSLAKHSRDKNLISKPATLQYTFPDNGRSSYSIDGALKATFLPDNSDCEYSLAIEDHKNSLIDKKQDSLSAVLGVETSVGDLETKGYVLIPDVSVAYNSDRVKKNSSLLIIGQLSAAHGRLGINKLKGNDIIKAYWVPTIGVEYRNVLDSEDDITGNVTRSYVNVAATVYPLYEVLDNGRLSITISFTNWLDLSESSAIDSGADSHDLFKCGISWELTDKPPEGTKKISVTLGLEWLDGEDLRDNKEQQRYGQVSLGFKY